MLGRMDVPATFMAPNPIDISIITTVPRAEVIERLDQAIGAKTYSKPGRFSTGYFRLGGAVAGTGVVTLTARPYVWPGLVAGYGASTIEFRGEVRSTDDGSEVRGIVTAPASRMILAFLAVILGAWYFMGLISNGSPWPNWIFMALGGLFLAVAWIWVVRNNQRMALRNVGELTLMVETIIRGPSAPIPDSHAAPATG